ncbi:rhodanese-like domain-containing protein 4A, chloroplastic isoform X1 [Typha angustifolia]|uniref:rhodanese-like domain-containing protein 4A, chloroplastic isoform X1 n=2 Tax=Typha angustifolia TaxID=59011 RepID=UPI003C2FB828
MALIHGHHFVPKSNPLSHPSPPKISRTHLLNLTRNHLSTRKISSFFKSSGTQVVNSPSLPVLTKKATSFSGSIATHLIFSLEMAAISLPFPSSAAETEQVSQKINLETILTSIDDFFTRTPFFVPGIAFIWLVVIPLTQEYLKKYKPITAIDAFRKLKDMPEAQLLDIRRKQSVMFMAPPNLKIFNKNVLQMEFSEGEEEGFVKEILKNYGDPANTIICVLDNFDGDSLKVAELLYKNGFKEAYAIKGGLRGKDGWQAIQEKCLPPSVHVYPRKEERRKAALSEINVREDTGNGQALASPSILPDSLKKENGYAKHTETVPEAKLASQRRSSSPYPNYDDLKPPSSPTPSKPRN